jgi:hypothetical protein
MTHASSLYYSNPHTAFARSQARRYNVGMMPNTYNIGAGRYTIGAGQNTFDGMAVGPAGAPASLHGGFGPPGASPLRAPLPGRIKGAPLGFDSGAVLVAAGAQVNVISRPQENYRPEKLLCDPGSAPSFQVADIRIGNRSQLLNAVPLPATMFIPNASGNAIALDDVQGTQDIVIVVVNFSAAAARFLAGMTGTAWV